MEARFLEYVDRLHPKFVQLMAMNPVKPVQIPVGSPDSVIYLLSEGGDHLYTGRTRKLRQRMGNHSRPSSQHNQAVFAFRLAREATGNVLASYSGEGRRAQLVQDENFNLAFTQSKERVRNMDLRFVEVLDPLDQALLEIYVSIVLKTPYNDFNTH